MVSARVIAYGAVVAAGLALLAPSGTARTASKSVETNQATKVAKGKVRTVKRKAVRVGRSAANARRKVAWAKQGKPRAAQRARHAKWKSVKDRRQHARRSLTLASASSQSPTGDSAIQRRFRGFIAPVAMSTNAFEVMRKPRLDSSHLAPAVAISVTEPVMVAPSMTASAVPAPSAEPETTGSAFQLASAESVVVGEPPVRAPAQVVESAKPKPAETPSDSLPLRELFLALCGALTAASAVRFVVGA
jgi:hypothetical protein